MLRPTFVRIAVVLTCLGGIPLLSAAETNSGQGQERTPVIGARFANGIAAIVYDRIITVGDIRRRIEPMLPQIINEARGDERRFQSLLQEVEDQIIQNLVDDILIIKDFYSDEKRRIPENYVDNEVEERLITEFDNDRAKFLEYLHSIGKTPLEYREMVREEMIVNYMRSQKRKSESIVSPVQIENYYTENRDKFFQDDAAHVRQITLRQVADESPAVLQQTADTIMAELRKGRDFGELARQYSQDSRKELGGDRGWIPKKDFLPEVAEAVFALEPGEFTEPIKLGNDILIMFVEDKREAGIQPIEDVRDEIEQTLINQMVRNATERWLERLRRDAYVRYFN